MTIQYIKGNKFPFGQLVVTRGVNDKLAEDGVFAKFVLDSLKRHSNGDWGDLCSEDKEQNDNALSVAQDEGPIRLFSAYDNGVLPKIWIITEADRSVTTVLFPSEY